jgi:hypothetical protein
MIIKHPLAISEALITTAIDLDHLVYPPKTQISAQSAYDIYTTYQDSLILLYNDDDETTPIGYISVFPIPESLIKKSVQVNTPIYQIITKEALIITNEPQALYLHNMLITPENQRKGYFKHLKAGLSEYVKPYPPETPIYADAVSSKGRNALSKMGFTSIHTFDEETHLYLTSVSSLKLT